MASIMSSYIIIGFCFVIFFIYVKCDDLMITSYAKVSRSGVNSENEGRNMGQRLWTQRSDVRISKKQPILEKYPVYTVTPRRKDYESNSRIVPAKGEVVIQERFIQPRPFGGKENVEERFTQGRPFATKPDPSYLPPPYPDKEKDNSPSYNSPYNSYNPPNLPASYFYPDNKDKPFPPYMDYKPKPMDTTEPPKDTKMEPMPPNKNHESKNEPFPPGIPEFLDYNPYEKPNKLPMKTEPKMPQQNEKPFPVGTPEYLDYNPYKKLPMDHIGMNHGAMTQEPKDEVPDDNKMEKPDGPEVVPYSNSPYGNPGGLKNEKFPPGVPPYLEYNPYEHMKHEMDENHDHGNSEDHTNDHGNSEDNNHGPNGDHGDSGHEHGEFNSHDHGNPNDHDSDDHNHHHGSSDEYNHDHGYISHDSQMPKPDMEPPKNFPAYLYDKVPYLEYHHDEKSPPLTQTAPDIHNYPYLDHHFHDFHFPPIYHEIKPPTTTEATKERVNKRPYTYYYIGRKLWYIPLYFSVYFIVYIFVLVLKSIARHKITFNQYFEEDRGMKEENELEKMTENVLIGIEHAEEKYER